MPSQLIAWTNFDYTKESIEATGWEPDALEINRHDGQQLAEFAGRDCYESYHRPNPATATNADYLKHILEVGHLSVLEHGTCTFYFTEVTRSFTHELIRHRHFSYSQLSQRYAPPVGDGSHVPHPELNEEEKEIALEAQQKAEAAYWELYHRLTERGIKGKKARQAARGVLPNQTPTHIVVTGNYRAWRHFLSMRCSLAADLEIRQEALQVLTQLKTHAPNVFGDFEIKEDSKTGEWYAESKYTWES